MAPVKNSAPEKWVYREHTRVKHEILQKYLYVWIIALGKWYKRICYFDGFAGRGEYTDGSPGSPIVAMQVAERLHKCFGEFVCTSIEKDKDNFDNLEAVAKREKGKYPHVKVLNIYGEFADVVSDVIKEVGARLAPSFFFIDPFGFSGVPFSLIKDILSVRRTEVFITFMYRDIARFLESDKVGNVLDELFGTSEWRAILRKGYKGIKREHALRDLYIRQLVSEAGVHFVWPFKVYMTEKRQTLYYLIHATNNFKGHFVMKNIMYKQGAGGQFTYLGPDDYALRQQMPLLDPDDIPGLKSLLLKKFSGQQKTYLQVEKETTMDTSHIERHYRRALKELKSEGLVEIRPVTSKTSRGLAGDDIVSFK